MNRRTITILAIGLVLCAVWALLVMPGSASHGHFYLYPLTIGVVVVWVAGWAVIIGIAVLTLFLTSRKKRK